MVVVGYLFVGGELVCPPRGKKKSDLILKIGEPRAATTPCASKRYPARAASGK